MAPYKNRLPKSDDETEYIDNLFNAICSTLMTERNRHGPLLCPLWTPFQLKAYRPVHASLFAAFRQQPCDEYNRWATT